MLESDISVETEAVDRLRRGIEYMRSISDVTSANIFEAILADEEHHIDYLETQLGLIEKLGEPLYLAQLIKQPGDRLLHRRDRPAGRHPAGRPVLHRLHENPAQFIQLQNALAADSLNEYIHHTGSAVFACPPGLRPGQYWGDALLT